MAFVSEFIPIQLRELPEVSKKMKADGARFVQLLAVHEDLGNALVYSFMKDDALLNYRIDKVSDEDTVPSITGEYLNAFVFENEVHDLFGVKITDIAIDFKGKFYKVTEPNPMCTNETVKKEMAAGAAKAKAEAQARAAAAAKAKAEAEAKAKAEAEAKAEEKPTEDKKETPKAEEKPAEAKKDAPAVDEALEKKLAGMDPEKAAKVRAAMEAKAKKAAEAAKKEEVQ
ncbi:MAG: NADH-quinone oxidoreductase subunit C [Eggerthellaceae bacterium]|nr:NADH-quinone oxidoreductase subunit C [Eggerthellaceae bacterium]